MEDEDDTRERFARSEREYTPSIYRSTLSNLNMGSQQTIYQSLRNTIYDDAISLNLTNNFEFSENHLQADDSSTLRGTTETVVEGSYGDLQESEEDGESNVPNDFITSSSLYFRDGVRSIDFVMVWDQNNEYTLTYKCNKLREIFEKNLESEGLMLEYEPPEPSGLRFIKIHAPQEVLRRYSEILKLRLPMKEVRGLEVPIARTNRVVWQAKSYLQRFMKRFYVDAAMFPAMKHRFTAVYSRDKEYLFDSDSPDFFTSGTHSRIVQFILDRTRFAEDTEDHFSFGIDRLIDERAYIAAYPLHDGNLRTPGSMRYLLYTEWARVRKCLHYQPLDYIKEYFGVKIGLYFAWLGFYTYMLVFASIAGFLCFLYGCLTVSYDKPSDDICNAEEIMCPLCDKYCDYWQLKKTCFHAKVTYLFDNPSTVVFSLFMSLWATLFLEFWKKYSAEITHRWDLTKFDEQEEHPRPQYLARLAHVRKKSVNVVTNTVEPVVPFWSMRLPATIVSFSGVLLLIATAVATVIGVIVYRMSVLTSRVTAVPSITSNAILFTTATAACINLFCILMLNQLYIRTAKYLTEMELPRTQTEFDDSLTLKIYLLQFVNHYASIFYIAFIKGKMTGYPRAYKRLFLTFRQEECNPAGCLTELCIQLSIIMIGKQIINAFLEMLNPLFYKWLNTLKVRVKPKNSEKYERMSLQWVRDFKLVQWGPRSLFSEYLEMVLQYGFVTIFVAAFPLAPFFALLNNVLEMRLDAKKLLTLYRKPVGQRVRDIGIWYRILDSISKLSVITNGFIIAFTSNFIPKLVYKSAVSENNSLEGFLRHSLSSIKTADLDYKVRPVDNSSHVDVCLYSDYREPPDSSQSKPYDLTIMYWHILAARLAFVVIFENAVAVAMILVRWYVPDMSPELRDQIRRETYITNEIIIQQEAERVCGRRGAVNEPEVIQRRTNDRERTDRWNRVIRTATESEFDLEVHGSPVSPPSRMGPAAL
ncbi:anoctamin-4-like [Venturia canescens]|uniref:anoctamin-4-like n=1 Tax=Venturia canescens TaxID=32260 RepID=UPI001C9CB13E|nr:anoctamin-4-like [Venturia canescens]XP_043284890.1 anoctamin-4-like [Venturia canescens]XP_043284898.1 anoctamin-4-like [Venturia canescens]XP_043284905.1 anoctamin-4-like [Venturia canescens]XP_043284911.1 anoctamin-4-like [Venturia canescens]XP_043284920.1 anoctamin-4-like [Venturia canescens]